jgi:hypothetical protein
VISTRARPPARDLAPRLKLIEPTGTDRLTGEPAVEHDEPCGERRKFLSDHDRDHGRGTTRLGVRWVALVVAHVGRCDGAMPRDRDGEFVA